MKRIFSGMIAILMAASLVFSSFAAPSIGKVVGATNPNGDYLFYIFGNGISENASEVGINIDGRDQDFKLQGEAEMEAALETKAFGIGINDSANALGDSFSVTPYEIVDGVKVSGEPVVISKKNAETADSVNLEKLFINGKAVPGFYTGTPETDFYYGLEELPETAEGVVY